MLISTYKMEIIKNYLKYSLWLVLIVFAALFGLHWLPAITIDGHTMRRVDILGDLRYPEPETAVADSDSIPLPPVIKPAFVDTCRAGMTCIEDYSDSTQRGMAPFYEALDRLSSSPSSSDSDADDKLVRITVFGDSFIEADIMTADLREMFQKRFGGCGGRFRYNYFHDKRLPSYGAAYIRWLVQSFGNGYGILRPEETRHLRPLFYSS